MRRKPYVYPDEWAMHDRIVNAYLAYGADLTMEALVFLGVVKEMIDQKAPLAPDDIHKLESLWDNFVRPLQERDAH